MPADSQNFAVLFAGGSRSSSNHLRYYNSLEGVYDVLVSQYDLPAENIQILYADGKRSGLNSSLFQDFASKLAAVYGRDRVALAQELSSEYLKTNLSENEAEILAKIFVAPMKGYSPSEFTEIKKFVENLNLNYSDKIKISYAVGESFDENRLLVNWTVLAASDMAFADGSSYRPGNAPGLEAALGELSNQVDSNDHVFFWTFDHGGFGAPLVDWVNIENKPASGDDRDIWGNRQRGNLATLTGWGDQVKNQDLAQWIAPVINTAGFTTLAYNQCFSGGMLEASRPELAAAEFAYGMAASNAYEVSNNYSFAEGVKLALQGSDNPIARQVFDIAKASDKNAAKYPYADNDGPRMNGVEHPWAYGGSNGNFPVFAVGDALHPLEQQGIDFQDSSEFVAESSLEQIAVSLDEDTSLDLQASLVDQFGPGVTVDAVTWPRHGSLEVVDGALIYTPMADFHGSDSFLLRYSTPVGTTEIRYSLEVSSVNDAPVASDTFVAVDSGERRVKFSVDSQPGFLGDFDLDGDALRVTNFSAPEHGRLKKVGKKNFKYKPVSGFEGTDSFLYQITDGEAYAVAEVTFTVGGDMFSRNPVGGSYRLTSEGSDPIVNPLRGRDGSVLSDDSSSRWDVVAARKDGNRYNLLLQGEGKKEGLYRVWTADDSGKVVNQRKRWLSPDQLEQKVYGSSFADVTRGNAIGQFENPVIEVEIIASI